ARFRAENLDYTAARKAAHAQGSVKRDGAGGDDRDGHNGFLDAQPHDGTLAKLLFNLRQRQIACFAFFSLFSTDSCLRSGALLRAGFGPLLALLLDRPRDAALLGMERHYTCPS